MQLTEILDQVGPNLHSNKTDQERMDDVLNHPFFMNSCKESDIEQETMTALQSLVFDGTPLGIF
jgi:hypothetical protein